MALDDITALTDHGGQPYVVDITQAARNNDNFRAALWTGRYLQMTLMSIKVGGSVGLEMHGDTDQFLLVERGSALVRMGGSKNDLNFRRAVSEGWGIFVPAGTWHNVINAGVAPLKLCSVYAPPEHPFGTVQPDKPE